jgi:hypothetical protein
LQGRIELDSSLPHFIESRFGWVVSGSTSSTSEILQSNHGIHCNLSINTEPQHFLMDGRWTDDVWTEEAKACEQHFKSTYQRNTEGRYVLRLPFRENVILGESKYIATKRLFFLLQQIKRNNIQLDYNKLMDNYLYSNHMEVVIENGVIAHQYYIPHHPIIKPDSSTTKLRVVFNASSKTTNGSSLNDVLMVGPTIQRDLFSIIIRFTRHRFVFVADIENMYRQILILFQIEII